MSALDSLEARFAALDVPTDTPGFYDHPRFVAAEREDPAFLERYAEYVVARPYTSDYVDRARVEVPVIAELVQKELLADGRLGACVDIGMILSRILEREGFWNAMIKGSLTITFPETSGLRRKFFYSFDSLQTGQKPFAAAHAWLIVPPFDIVDIAARQQPYREGAEFVPPLVLVEGTSVVDANPKEVFSPEFIQGFALAERLPEVLVPRHAKPDWRTFLTVFPAREVTIDGTSLRYTPVAVGAPDAPFEQMKNWKVNGRYGIKLYRDTIQPALDAIRG